MSAIEDLLKTEIIIEQHNGDPDRCIICFGVREFGHTEHTSECQFELSRVEYDHLLSERKEMLELLREVEFCIEDGPVVCECPVCGSYGEIPEHKPDCRLAAMIAKLEAE